MNAHASNAGLALALSILVWIAVGTQVNINGTPELKVRIEIEPEDVIATCRGRTTTGKALELNRAVQVIVRGPREQVEAAERKILEALVKIEDNPQADAWQVTVSLEESIVGLARNLEIVKLDPPELTVELRRSVKQLVWVKPGKLVGEPASGMRLAPDPVSIPLRSQVEVRGPGDVLAAAAQPFETEPIKLDGAKKSFLVPRAVMCPPGVEALSGVEVRVELIPDPVERELVFPIRILPAVPEKEEPVRLPSPVEALDGWTRTIKLRGPARVLDELKQRLDQAILGRRFDDDESLPQAHVLAADIPARPGLELTLPVYITGLPPGVAYAERVKFALRVGE